MVAKHAPSLLVFAWLMLTAPSAGAQEWYVLGGVFDCIGRSIGENVVKLNCQQELQRGSRIYTITPNFTISGPIARQYLGKHSGCRPVDPSETRAKQAFVDCPGIPKWW